MTPPESAIPRLSWKYLGFSAGGQTGGARQSLPAPAGNGKLPRRKRPEGRRRVRPFAWQRRQCDNRRQPRGGGRRYRRHSFCFAGFRRLDPTMNYLAHSLLAGDDPCPGGRRRRRRLDQGPLPGPCRPTSPGASPCTAPSTPSPKACPFAAAATAVSPARRRYAGVPGHLLRPPACRDWAVP